jgi:hypothetical protein
MNKETESGKCLAWAGLVLILVAVFTMAVVG